jgi:hypothetical protein
MNDLLVISIRRKLDKGDKIGTNEIRALLATLAAVQNKLEETQKRVNELEVEKVEAAK